LIAGILLVAGIYFAKPILLPLTLAWIAKVVLSPIVRRLRRLGIPLAVSSLMVIAVGAGGLAFGVYELSGPAQEWLASLPTGLDEVQERLRDVARPIGEVSDAAHALVDGVEKAVAPTSAAVPVSVQGGSPAISNIFSGAQSIAAVALATLALLFFLLISDEAFLGKIVGALPRFADKKLAVKTVHAIEENISRYLITLTVINLVLGLAIGTSLWAMGMPNPALWGVMAAVLNFIPYLGPLVGAIVVAAAALLTFDGIGHVLIPPLVYLAWNALEGMVITPLVLGRALLLSPVLVFVWFLAWSWLWGIPGALLAVPLLAATKIVADSVPSLQPLGRLLAR